VVDAKFDMVALASEPMTQPASQDAAERLFKARIEADNAATRRAMMEMLTRIASQLK
jgi:hypothetical protein